MKVHNKIIFCRILLQPVKRTIELIQINTENMMQQIKNKMLKIRIKVCAKIKKK